MQKPWDRQMELVVNVELNAPDEGRFRRPYVAVWIEDRDGKMVRTLALWFLNTGKGWRWLRDLRRWWRNESRVPAAEANALVASVSSPTRQAGRYTLVWDGQDDRRQPVPQGDYVLYIEAAREHGTYQLMKQDLAVAAKPFKADLPGNVEVKSASVELRRKK